LVIRENKKPLPLKSLEREEREGVLFWLFSKLLAL
jgi:hypothetical protein